MISAIIENLVTRNEIFNESQTNYNKFYQYEEYYIFQVLIENARLQFHMLVHCSHDYTLLIFFQFKNLADCNSIGKSMNY